MTWTNYGAKKMAEHFFQNTATGIPSNWYIGLIRNDGTEVSGPGYSRISVTRDATQFTHTEATKKTVNDAELPFAAPSGLWADSANQVTHFGVFDALTGGNEWLRLPLTLPKTINNGDPAPKINAGQFGFTWHQDCP